MKREGYTVKSPLKLESEDALVQNERLGIYGVLDGVTPLHGFRNEEGHTPAYLAARLVGRYLEEAEEVRSLALALAEANACLLEAMRQHRVDLALLDERWSTCAAIVQVPVYDEGERGNEGLWLRYAAAGDSMIVVRDQEGGWRCLTKDRVRGVDIRAVEHRARQRAAGVPLPPEEGYADPIRRMRYNRTLANSDEGYDVLNGMPEVAAYIQSGEIALADVSHVVLMTDGMFAPLESPEDAAARLIAAKSLDRYAAWVEQEEQRLGLRPDDKSAMVLTL